MAKIQVWSKHLATGDKQPRLIKGSLRIYSMRFCPFAQRALLVLDAKKVKYDTVNVNLDHKPEWLLEKSVGGKVPAIEFEDGVTLYESLIVADYLDETYPEPSLYPNNARSKALDRLLIERFNTVIPPLFMILDEPNITAELKIKLLTALEPFEKELVSRNTTFYGGIRPGMLDLMIWPFIERMPAILEKDGSAFDLSANGLPRLFAFQQAMINDENVKQSYLPPKLQAKYLEGRRTKNRKFDFDISDYV